MAGTTEGSRVHPAVPLYLGLGIASAAQYSARRANNSRLDQKPRATVAEACGTLPLVGQWCVTLSRVRRSRLHRASRPSSLSAPSFAATATIGSGRAESGPSASPAGNRNLAETLLGICGGTHRCNSNLEILKALLTAGWRPLKALLTYGLSSLPLAQLRSARRCARPAPLAQYIHLHHLPPQQGTATAEPRLGSSAGPFGTRPLPCPHRKYTASPRALRHTIALTGTSLLHARALAPHSTNGAIGSACSPTARTP